MEEFPFDKFARTVVDWSRQRRDIITISTGGMIVTGVPVTLNELVLMWKQDAAQSQDIETVMAYLETPSDEAIIATPMPDDEVICLAEVRILQAGHQLAIPFITIRVGAIDWISPFQSQIVVGGSIDEVKKRHEYDE